MNVYHVARSPRLGTGFKRVRNTSVRLLTVAAHGLKIPTKDREWTSGLLARFEAADKDGNGVINRAEFRQLVDNGPAEHEYAPFRWLTSEQIDLLFDKYDTGSTGGISYSSFRKLADDSVLLKGRLAEYRAMFDSCEVDEDGLIGPSCIYNLGQNLEEPLTEEQVAEAMEAVFPDAPDPAARRTSFEGFLALFRSNFTDLDQIVQYMALPPPDDGPLQPPPPPPREGAPVSTAPTAEAIAQAAALVPGIKLQEPYQLESSEQFDACMTLFHGREVVLLAGLSWCRPCRALSRPFEKLAKEYKDAVFVKVYGDTNDNTKRFFKNRLEVKATPHLSFHRDGECLFSRTGANKSKLEESVRAYYNQDNSSEFKLPSSIVYPPVNKPGTNAPTAATSTTAGVV